MNVLSRFPTLPPRLARLPLSEKGFPVPWFVYWSDEGKPDFRVVGAGKLAKAVKQRLCWVCGEPLGVHLAFVIGPMCGINHVISDPPSHRECATWSAQNCPFLSRPLAQRNTRDALPDGSEFAPGFGIRRNPGATGVWVTRSYRRFKVEQGDPGILFSIGVPEEVLWFSSGRSATRAEVDQSVATGLSLLEEMARAQGSEALQELQRQRGIFHRLLNADARLK